MWPLWNSGAAHHRALVLDPDDYGRRRMLDNVATDWGSARSVALTMSTNRRTLAWAAWETP